MVSYKTAVSPSLTHWRYCSLALSQLRVLSILVVHGILWAFTLLVSTRKYSMMTISIPDSKVHGANMGPIWGRQDPGGPMLAPWTLLYTTYDKRTINRSWSSRMVDSNWLWCIRVEKLYKMQMYLTCPKINSARYRLTGNNWFFCLSYLHRP